MKLSQILKESFDVSSFVTSEMTPEQLLSLYKKDYTDNIDIKRSSFRGIDSNGNAKFLVLIDSSQDKFTEEEDHYIVTYFFVKLAASGFVFEPSGMPLFNSSDMSDAEDVFNKEDI